MKNEEIHKLITDQRLELKQDIKEAIKDNNSYIHALMINEVDRVDKKVDKLVDHAQWQNDKLSKHHDRLSDLEDNDLKFEQYQENCPANKLANKLTKRWFWYVLAGSIVLIYIILATVYHTTGFGAFIDKLL